LDYEAFYIVQLQITYFLKLQYMPLMCGTVLPISGIASQFATQL